MPPRPDVSAERRAQIIQAALACFTRAGYNNTTMDDIVAESGLSKGSLYWYFESKDDLFIAALASLFTDLGEDALAAMTRGPTAEAKLRAALHVALNFSQTAEGFFGLLLEFWVSSPHREKAGESWIGLLMEYKDVLTEIVEEGVQSGEFRPVDAESLVWAMMAAYDGLAAYVMFAPDLDLERISEVFVETLLQGMLARE